MLATTASITSANRIKRRCAELGVFCTVIQTPQILSKDGCGYSLRFEDSAKAIIQKASNELGIRIRAFYTEEPTDGKKNYVKEQD